MGSHIMIILSAFQKGIWGSIPAGWSCARGHRAVPEPDTAHTDEEVTCRDRRQAQLQRGSW